MKKIGLIGAMNSEVEAFCRDFSAVPTNIPGIFCGSFGQYEIYIQCCGIGKVNAAIGTQKMIDFFGVDCIINSGVAGGISEQLSKLDVVISEQLTYHDFNPLDILDRYPPYSKYIKADELLVNKAKQACEKLCKRLSDSGKKTFKYMCGMIVTGDCFVSSSEKAAQLREDFGALCTEMEGAAIAHTAKVNDIPFVVIRAISDFADEAAEESFDSFENVAAERAAFIVKESFSE